MCGASSFWAGNDGGCVELGKQEMVAKDVWHCEADLGLSVVGNVQSLGM